MLFRNLVRKKNLPFQVTISCECIFKSVRGFQLMDAVILINRFCVEKLLLGRYLIPVYKIWKRPVVLKCLPKYRLLKHNVVLGRNYDKSLMNDPFV